jgi:hypothetical protein
MAERDSLSCATASCSANHPLLPPKVRQSQKCDRAGSWTRPLSLAVGAAVLWLAAGIAIGVVSALKRGTAFDRAAMGVALTGVSLPIFFTGLIALQLFTYQWPVFPDPQFVPFTENPSPGHGIWCCRGRLSRSFMRLFTPG